MSVVRKPLTARGIIASTLLGTDPPLLSARRLSRAGELFGVSPGTIRVALSRMSAAGELAKEDRGYRLTGELLVRQERQRSGRTPLTSEWNGQWEITIVTATGRSAAERASLRAALAALRLAERREGVWMRPDNLASDRNASARAEVDVSCETHLGRPRNPDDAPRLAGRLWDLSAWAADAAELCTSLEKLSAELANPATSDGEVLAPGFIESAAVLRHLTLDPVLPPELEPEGWPAAELRSTYDAFDAAYRRELRHWLDAV